jgi:hypothetical protein
MTLARHNLQIKQPNEDLSLHLEPASSPLFPHGLSFCTNRLMTFSKKKQHLLLTIHHDCLSNGIALKNMIKKLKYKNEKIFTEKN